MTTPTRPGRGPQPPDREPGPVGLLARIFLTQFLVVLAVATVIASVFILAGGDEDRTASDEAAASASPTAAASPDADDPSPSPTGSAPAATETPAAETPSTSAPASSPAEPKTPKVDVLNQSAGGNAAERTADLLREAGWRIGRVDDFNGTVQMTTVYYPLGLTEQAQAVAADMPGEPRVIERFSTLSDKRVTVILVD